jgi:hypothetical protein
MGSVSLKDDIAAIEGKDPAPPKKKAKKKVISKKAVTDKLFAEALIRNELNATAAYKEIKPHVTDATAGVEGHKLLKRPNVLEILLPKLESLFIKAGIETEYVFRRWVEIASGSPLDYFNVTEDGRLNGVNLKDLTPAQRSNLKSITVSDTAHGQNIKVETYDAQKAVDSIAKHLGLLVDKMSDEDVERIGDLIERGVNRIRETKDLDGWKEIDLGVDYKEAT